MEPSSPADMLEFAIQLAAHAGRHVQSHGRGSAREKWDGSLVTDADQQIQDHILQAIVDRFPDHAIVAEESGGTVAGRVEPGRGRYCWVIDPLDGTRNFVLAFPCYATSIAVLDQGRPVVAAIAEHCTETTYAACVGHGFTVNGRLPPSPVLGAGNDRLVGVPSTKDELTLRVVQAWTKESGLVLRNLGSTAVHLALVATGALSGLFCRRCKIWDIAAGALLVEESGGTITNLDGDARIPFDLAGDHVRDLPIVAGTATAYAPLFASVAGTEPTRTKP